MFLLMNVARLCQLMGFEMGTVRDNNHRSTALDDGLLFTLVLQERSYSQGTRQSLLVTSLVSFYPPTRSDEFSKEE